MAAVANGPLSPMPRSRLGILILAYFAGGSLKLDPDRARVVIDSVVAKPLGLSLDHAALGIHRVVNAQMAEGIRLVSISRGIDPRQFALVALGGAGPLARHGARERTRHKHCCCAPQSRRSVGDRVALGHNRTRSVRGFSPCPVPDFQWTPSGPFWMNLMPNGARLMAQEQAPIDQVTKNYYADVCYVGQAHYIEVPLELDAEIPLERLFNSFCTLHERQYGHHTRSPIKIVNLRAVHRAETTRSRHGYTRAGRGRRPQGTPRD